MIRRIEIRVFGAENKNSQLTVIKAQPNRMFLDENIRIILEKAGEQVMEKMPGHGYKLVVVGEGKFNFVWLSYPSAPMIQEGTRKRLADLMSRTEHAKLPGREL